MDTIIKGKAYVLGDDIDTDQIIPAHHLVYNLDDSEERKKYGVFALSGVPLDKAGLPQGNMPFIIDGSFTSEYQIIIAGKNFGCGSSREHAPVALNVAGVQVVIATSYARIFYRNAVDGGYLIPFESGVDLSRKVQTGDLIEIYLNEGSLKNVSRHYSYPLKSLGEVADIVEAGGIFGYAKIQGIVKS